MNVGAQLVKSAYSLGTRKNKVGPFCGLLPDFHSFYLLYISKTENPYLFFFFPFSNLLHFLSLKLISVTKKKKHDCLAFFLKFFNLGIFTVIPLLF